MAAACRQKATRALELTLNACGLTLEGGTHARSRPSSMDSTSRRRQSRAWKPRRAPNVPSKGSDTRARGYWVATWASGVLWVCGWELSRAATWRDAARTAR